MSPLRIFSVILFLCVSWLIPQLGFTQSQCDIPSYNRPTAPYSDLDAIYNLSIKLNPNDTHGTTGGPFGLRVCFNTPSADGATWDSLSSNQMLTVEIPVPKPNGEIAQLRLVVSRFRETEFTLGFFLKSEDVDFGPIVPGYARRQYFQGLAGVELDEISSNCGNYPNWHSYTKIPWNSGPPSFINITFDSILPTSGDSKLVYLNTNFDPPNNYATPPVPSNADSDNDGLLDCYDECSQDPEKFVPGECGCGNQEIENCGDTCPEDPLKTSPGECGCGVVDTSDCSQSISEIEPPAPEGTIKNHSARITAQKYQGATQYEFILKKSGGKRLLQKSKNSSVKFQNVARGLWSASYKIRSGKLSSKRSKPKMFLVR